MRCGIFRGNRNICVARKVKIMWHFNTQNLCQISEELIEKNHERLDDMKMSVTVYGRTEQFVK